METSRIDLEPGNGWLKSKEGHLIRILKNAKFTSAEALQALKNEESVSLKDQVV